jgi:hypothetical protein
MPAIVNQPFHWQDGIRPGFFSFFGLNIITMTNNINNYTTQILISSFRTISTGPHTRHLSYEDTY